MPQVDDNKWNLAICKQYCSQCPSFCEREGEEGLYCARGDSAFVSKIQKQGCHCPECQIYQNYELTGSYFCITGKFV